ncbi:MAG: hypothetical protein KGR26_06460, partial [Cyanobacteria bacterium REEB65]|nr:hypothetical protein [Cyanobacteria bacterium REEB65]
ASWCDKVGRMKSLQRDPAAETTLGARADRQDSGIRLTCPDWGPIAFRHVAGPSVGDPRQLLSTIVPPGWTLVAFKLSQVTTHLAVAFTHRVTYGAPCLAGSTEERHDDVLLLGNGIRIAALCGTWSQLATLPAKAPEQLEGVAGLYTRARALVEARSADRSRALTRSLHERLGETEKRLSRHYQELRRAEQEREVASLSGRLASVLGQIPTAKPSDLAKLQAEGAEVAKRLDQAKKGHSASGIALGQIEAAALATERERHALALQVDLVESCLLAFDEVTYQVAVRDEAGTLSLDLVAGYVPVTGAVRMPRCTACGQAVTDPVVTSFGQYCCLSCTRSCAGCGSVTVRSEPNTTVCGACDTEVCRSCGSSCRHCAELSCSEHRLQCSDCGDVFCSSCAAACQTCRRPSCAGCSIELVGRHYCLEHVSNCERCQNEVPDELGQRCHLTNAFYCVACALSCLECGKVTKRELLQPAPGGRGLVCPSHLVSCPACQTGLLPRESTECATCDRKYCSDDVPACPQCGLPTCAECFAREEGRCGICLQLAPVAADDLRLGQALLILPDQGANRWLLAEGETGYRVVEWHGHFGAWGRLALSPQGDVVYSCDYGPVKAWIQEIGAIIAR